MARPSVYVDVTAAEPSRRRRYHKTSAWRFVLQEPQTPARPRRADSGSLPAFDAARHHVEERMGRRRRQLPPLGVFWAARGEFRTEMCPFVVDLPGGHREPRSLGACHKNPALIEAISSRLRLLVKPMQIPSDRRQRVRAVAKSDELRMVPVALRSTGQHGLSKQRLAPSGDQARSIQMRRVQRPDSHRVPRSASGIFASFDGHQIFGPMS